MESPLTTTGNHLKIGLIGLPNSGKSSLFNLLGVYLSNLSNLSYLSNLSI
jgi:GTPase SAR1 family protein